MVSQIPFRLVQIINAPKPDPAYFTDPNQNPAADILKAFTPAGQSIGTVTGPDFISYAPCLVRWAAPHTCPVTFCVAEHPRPLRTQMLTECIAFACSDAAGLLWLHMLRGHRVPSHEAVHLTTWGLPWVVKLTVWSLGLMDGLCAQQHSDRRLPVSGSHQLHP